MSAKHPTYVPYGPQENCTLSVCPVEDSVYEYRPSLGANAALIAVFGVSMIIHMVQGIRWRTWVFLVAIVLGCVSEMIGYGGRIILYQNPFSFTGFMTQIGMYQSSPPWWQWVWRGLIRLDSLHHARAGVLLCRHLPDIVEDVRTGSWPWIPAAFDLANTKVSSIIYLGAQYSRLRPSFYYWMFIPCDLVSLTLQATGGAMSSSTSGKSKVGVDIAIAGLSFQVFTLSVFILLALDYTRLYMRGQRAQEREKEALPASFKVFVAFLSFAILCILIRCVYRIDELSDGYDGPLIHDENLFIGLEGV
jgi:hypothetical protein